MTETQKRRWKLLYGDDLYCKDDSTPFIVDNFLGEGDHMLVHAKKGVGKSVTAMQLMCNLTTQMPFLDTFAINKRCKVLWMQGESTHKKFDQRIINMKKSIGCDDSLRYFCPVKRCGFNIDSDYDEIMEELVSHNINFDIIILDSLYNFVKGSKNCDDVAGKWTSNFDAMCGHFGAAAISLGHTGKDSFFQQRGGGATVVTKGNSAKGATEWDAAFSIIYELQEIDKKQHVLRLVNHKDRDGECVDEFTYQMITPQKDKKARLMLTIHAGDVNYNQFAIRDFLDKNNRILTSHEIWEELKMPESSFYHAVKQCVKEGTVIKTNNEHGRVAYKSSKLL